MCNFKNFFIIICFVKVLVIVEFWFDVNNVIVNNVFMIVFIVVFSIGLVFKVWYKL